MKEISLNHWEDLEEEIERLENETQQKRADTLRHFSKLLFRGEHDLKMNLKTTLEKFSNRNFSLNEYNHLILSIRKIVETVTGKSWKIDDSIEPNEDFLGPPPNYDFMAYLRHHGFPSPLLDWTRSPYIAAFFAFNKAFPKTGDFVSLFCFQEYAGEGKGGSLKEATIIGLGPYIATHKRHYIQQSEYTICKKKVGDDYYYCPHEEAFARGEEAQDILRRYLMPTTEKEKVLSKLDKMNINAYSLFATDDALMDTLAQRMIKKD